MLNRRGCAGTTNPEGTQKPDNPLKGICYPKSWNPDNHFKGIQDLLPNVIESQYPIGLTVTT